MSIFGILIPRPSTYYARTCRRSRCYVISVRERDVERGGQAVGNRQSGERRHQPTAAIRLRAHDESAVFHQTGDQGAVGSQQVGTVARQEAVEVDPGRGAEPEEQRLRRELLRTQDLLRLDRALPRRDSSLPARRAPFVPPTAGHRGGACDGQRVGRGAETEVWRVVPVLAVV